MPPPSSPAPAPLPTAHPDPAEEPGREPRHDRSLLSEIGARLAQVVRDLRGSSQIRESLEEVIEESERQAKHLSGQERLMLANLLKFGDLRVSDVMVPRTDIVAVEEKTPLAELIGLFRDAQHSRLPLYRETLDDPLGMVHIKDVMGLTETMPDGQLRWRETPIMKLRREMLYVPAAMPVLDLLLKMQATHIHMGLVVDEYGGTDGLVTIEDLVEEIVGDIDDEHDVDEEPKIARLANGGFDADARVDLDDFKERTGIDFSSSLRDEDVDTLGGLIFAQLGRVPARGEIVALAGDYEFEVLEADPRRVKRLRIRPKRTLRAGPAR